MLAISAGSGTSPASVPFNVSYTDGSTTPFSQGISDWFAPQNFPGEEKAITMPYRLRNGVKDARTFYAYGYSFSLDNKKVVKSFILPNQPEVKVIAITLTP